MGDYPFEPGLRSEPFRRDDAVHYVGHIESRVLIDPAWVELGDPFTSFSELNQLVQYARKVSTPTKIELLYPGYLKPKGGRKPIGAFIRESERRDVGPPSEPSAALDIERALTKAKMASEELKARMRADAEQQKESKADDVTRALYGLILFDRPEGIDLLLLAREHRCDYVFTENPWLLESADALRKEAGIWVSSPEDTLDLLQLSLRAAGVFIEVVHPISDEHWGELGRLRVGIEGLGFQSFYHMENRGLMRYQAWLSTVIGKKKENRIFAHGRAALYHRFPFLLYAHDMVRYHALYSQRFAFDNRYRGDHRFYVGYHLNAFYVMLAALLDNLAWLWNYYFDLGYKETDSSRNKCVLTHGDFKKRIRPFFPDLIAVVEAKEFSEWLGNLTLKRHPAVHREPLFLTEIIEQGTGRVLSESASVVEDKKGYRIFDLLSHADHDRQLLFRFMDAVTKLPLPEPVMAQASPTSSRDAPTR